MRGICINWKLVIGLGAVALGVVVVAPQLALGLLPVLVVAACPLSCLVMMRSMGRGSGRAATGGEATAGAMDAIALSQGERIARLQAEISRLHAQESGVAPELERSEPTDRRRPVA